MQNILASKAINDKIFCTWKIFTNSKFHYLQFRPPMANIIQTFSNTFVGVPLFLDGCIFPFRNKTKTFISYGLRVVTGLVRTISKINRKYQTFISIQDMIILQHEHNLHHCIYYMFVLTCYNGSSLSSSSQMEYILLHTNGHFQPENASL